MAKITLVLEDRDHQALSARYGDVTRFARDLLVGEASRLPKPKNTAYEPRRAREIYLNARKTVLKADGEWVRWHDLRPQHRDRDLYTDAMWDLLRKDPGIEVQEKKYGGLTRRSARYRPLI